MLTAVRGSGKPMMNYPQLSKPKIIVLRCEERFHHDLRDKAPKRAESTTLLPSGHWLWRSILEIWPLSGRSLQRASPTASRIPWTSRATSSRRALGLSPRPDFFVQIRTPGAPADTCLGGAYRRAAPTFPCQSNGPPFLARRPPGLVSATTRKRACSA